MTRSAFARLLPVARVADLVDGPVARVWRGERIVLFRAGGGIGCLKDECPHRQARLSNGFVCRGDIVCTEHGWRFDRQGVCTHAAAPGMGSEERQAVQAYRSVVLFGFVFIAGRR